MGYYVDPHLLAAEHQTFQKAASEGISVIAASSDFGSAQFTCDGSSLAAAVAFPASGQELGILICHKSFQQGIS